MLNRILLFLFVLFSINVCLVGLGVANEQMLYKMNILDKPVDDISEGANVNVYGGQQQQTSGYAVDNPNYLSTAPSSKESKASFDKTMGLIYGLTIGYSAIFVLLGLPSLLVFLLTAIIGIFQIFAIFYMTSYFIGIFRGASI